MSVNARLQDPAETLDHNLDWTAWMGASGDTIASSTWTISPAGPVLSGQAVAGLVTTCLVAGVTLAAIYRLQNTITTAQGRHGDDSITIRAFPK
jgi:hypothetical protein